MWYDGFITQSPDGIQGTGPEAPIVGRKVDLYNSGGGLLATTYTDITGHYLFSNLAAGDYQIHFDYSYGYAVDAPIMIPGAPYMPATGNVARYAGGDTARDSNKDGFGWTEIFHLNIGQNRRDIDAGYTDGTPIALDLDGNGTRADGSSVAMVDVYFETMTIGEHPAPAPVAPAQANTLANLLQPSDELLHKAMLPSEATATPAAAAPEAADGGEALRQLLAAWNSHSGFATQAA